MKKIIFLILFIQSNLYSQDVIKKYDKYENKFYLSLRDNILLYQADTNETYTFELNILKIYNSQDTSYYLVTSAIRRNKLKCNSVESRCLISYDKNQAIILKPLHIEYDKTLGSVSYNFDFLIPKSDLLNLLTAKTIEIIIFCSDGELQGDFSEDNFEDFRKFIKNYVK